MTREKSCFIIFWIFFGSTTCHRTLRIWIIGARGFLKDWFAKNIEIYRMSVSSWFLPRIDDAFHFASTRHRGRWRQRRRRHRRRCQRIISHLGRSSSRLKIFWQNCKLWSRCHTCLLSRSNSDKQLWKFEMRKATNSWTQQVSWDRLTNFIEKT